MKKWLILTLCLVLLLSGCKAQNPKTDETAEVITHEDEKTPEVEVEVPEKEEKTPEVEVEVPEKEEKTPEVEVEVSEKEEKTPEVEVEVPEKEEKTPEVEEKEPESIDEEESADIDKTPEKTVYDPITETDPMVNKRENGDISFNGKDAYIVGYTDDYVVLRPQGFTSYDYIQVMTDTTYRDIVINEMVYMKGHAIKLEADKQIPFPSDEPHVPIAFTVQDGFEIEYKFDPESIGGIRYKMVYIGEDFGVFVHEKRYIRADYDFSDYCVGDYLFVEGKAVTTAPENYTLDDGKEITVTYKMKDFTVRAGDDFVIAKPVIYLYPEKTTDVFVKVDLEGELTCVYPEYNGGWEVTAMPDGTLYDENGREYYCLYWEADMYDGLLSDKTNGFCVKGEDTAEFLRQKALELGLSGKEANEFIIYWLPQMEDNPYNYVYFSIDEYKKVATLDITPAADTVIRFAMLWSPLEKPIEIKEQILPKTPVRQGFTVVEWGGAKIK